MRVFRMKNICLIMAMVLAILPLFSYMAVAEGVGLSIIENPVDDAADDPAIDEPDDPDNPVEETPVPDKSGGEAPVTMEIEEEEILPAYLDEFQGPMYTNIFFEHPFVFFYTSEINEGNILKLDDTQIYPALEEPGGEELSLIQSGSSTNVLVAYRYDDDDDLCLLVFVGGEKVYDEKLDSRAKNVFTSEASGSVPTSLDEEDFTTISEPQSTTPFGLKYEVELVEEDGNQIQQIKILHTNISTIATGQGFLNLMSELPDDPAPVTSLGEDCLPVNLDLDPLDFEPVASPYYMDFDFGFDSLTLDYNTDDFMYWGDIFEIPDYQAPDTIQSWQLFFKVFTLGQWPVEDGPWVPEEPDQEEGLEGEAYSEDLMFMLPGILMIPDLKYINFVDAHVTENKRVGEYYSELSAYYMFRTDKARPFEYWLLEEGESLSEDCLTVPAKYYIIIDDAYYPFTCRDDGMIVVPTNKFDEYFYLDDYHSENCRWFDWDYMFQEENMSDNDELVDKPKYMDEMDVDFVIEWPEDPEGDLVTNEEVEIPLVQINDIVDHTIVFDDYIDTVAVSDFDWINLTNDAMGTILHTYDYNAMLFTDDQYDLPFGGNMFDYSMGIANSQRHALFMQYFLLERMQKSFSVAEAESILEDGYTEEKGGLPLNTVEGYRVWQDNLGEQDDPMYYDFPPEGDMPYMYFRKELLGKGTIVTESPEPIQTLAEEGDFFDGQWWMPPWFRYPNLDLNYEHVPAKEIWATRRLEDFWHIGFYFNRQFIDDFDDYAEDQNGSNLYTMSPLKLVAPFGERDYVILKTGGEEFGMNWHDRNFVMPIKLGIDGNYTAWFDYEWIPLVDNTFEVTLYDEMRHRMGMGGNAVVEDMEEDCDCHGMDRPSLPLRIYGVVSDEITDEYLEYMEPEGEFMFEEYFSPEGIMPEYDVHPELIGDADEEIPVEVDREFYLNMSSRFTNWFNTFDIVPKYDWDQHDQRFEIEDPVPITRVQMDVDYYEHPEVMDMGENVEYPTPYEFRYFPVKEFQIDFYGETFGEEVMASDFASLIDDDYTFSERAGRFGWVLENLSRPFPPHGMEPMETVYKPFMHDLTPTAMMLFRDDDFEVVEEEPGRDNVVVYNFGHDGYDYGEDALAAEGGGHNEDCLKVRVYNNVPTVIDGNEIYEFEMFKYCGDYVEFEVGQDEDGWYYMLKDSHHCRSSVEAAASMSEEAFEEEGQGPNGNENMVQNPWGHKFRIGDVEEDIMVMFDRKGQWVHGPNDSEFKDNQDIMIYHTLGPWMLEDRSDYDADFSHELYVENAELYYYVYDFTGMQGLYYDFNMSPPDPVKGTFPGDDPSGEAMILMEITAPVEEEAEAITGGETAPEEEMVVNPEDYYQSRAKLTEALIGGALSTIITNPQNERVQYEDHWPKFEAFFTNDDDYLRPERVKHGLTYYGMDKFVEGLDMVTEASDIVTYKYGENTTTCILVDEDGNMSTPIDLTGVDQSDPANRMISFNQTHNGTYTTVYYQHPDDGWIPMGGENDDFKVIFHEEISCRDYDPQMLGEESMDEERRKREKDKDIHVLYDSLYDVPSRPTTTTTTTTTRRNTTTTTETIIDEEVALGLPEFSLPYISGYPGQVFIPDNYLTRQELATIVYRLSGLNPIVPETQTFPDVGPDMWSYDFIETVNALELMDGQFTGNFGLYSPMTNGQFFEVMANYLDYFEVEYIAPTESPFGLPATTMNYDDLLRVYATGALDDYTEISTLDLVMRKDAVRIINKLIGRSTEFETAPDPSFLDVTILHPYFYDIEAASRLVPQVTTQ